MTKHTTRVQGIEIMILVLIDVFPPESCLFTKLFSKCSDKKRYLYTSSCQKEVTNRSQASAYRGRVMLTNRD